MRNTIIFIVVAIVVVGGMFYYFSAREVTAPISEIAAVPILSEFEDKVVYTTDASTEMSLLQADCLERGGEFNECGSVCAVGVEACIDVCAYTCELGVTSEPEDFGEPEEFTAETAKLAAVEEFSGEGIATRDWDGLAFIHTVTAKLELAPANMFYEGWLVQGTKFFSTGRLDQAGGGYSLTYTNTENQMDYNKVVVTLETLKNGFDNKPEVHVLEGEF